MITYEYHKGELTITERKTVSDYEFEFKVHSDNVLRHLKEVRNELEGNDDLTDVSFATSPGNVYSAAVRHNFRTDFLLILFKHQVLHTVKRDD